MGYWNKVFLKPKAYSLKHKIFYLENYAKKIGVLPKNSNFVCVSIRSTADEQFDGNS